MDCKVFLVLLVNMAIKVLLALWVPPALGALLVLLALLAKMVALDILEQLDLLAFVALRVAKVLLALLVLLAPLDLQAQVVVVMTSVMMETSIGLTSLVHHLLSDPRIMKLMLL